MRMFFYQIIFKCLARILAATFFISDAKFPWSKIAYASLFAMPKSSKRSRSTDEDRPNKKMRLNNDEIDDKDDYERSNVFHITMPPPVTLSPRVCYHGNNLDNHCSDCNELLLRIVDNRDVLLQIFSY